jgi:hypothetical protein
MDRAQLASCVEELGAGCERDVGWKIRIGVVAVGAEPQEECIEGLAAANCNALKALLGDDDADLFELTTQCEMAELLQPRSALGGACGDTSDCTEGQCPSLAPVCHRCSPFVPMGGPCSPGVLVCDPARALCAPSAQGGATCQPIVPHAREGQSCGDSASCAAGLYCRDTGGQRICAFQAKTGEACVDQPGACAELEASCVAGKCLVRPFSLGAAQPCRQFTDCAPGLYCKGTQGGRQGGACAPQGKPGEACEALDFGACPADASCYNDRCHKLRSRGQTCNSPQQCKAFLSCVPASGGGGLTSGATCAPYARVGEACNPYVPCIASFCDATGGKCVPLGEAGAPCKVAQQCESNWCMPNGACYAPCPREAADSQRKQTALDPR